MKFFFLVLRMYITMLFAGFDIFSPPQPSVYKLHVCMFVLYDDICM